jgi:hypothetical protein
MIVNKKIQQIELTNKHNYEEKIDTVYSTFYSPINKEVLEYNYGGETFNQIKIRTYDGPDYVFNFSLEDQCCEVFGYFHSFDIPDLKNYAEATLLEIELTYEEQGEIDYGEKNTVFIKFKTDRGDFSLTVYNEHNGYYGHQVNFEIRNIV